MDVYARYKSGPHDSESTGPIVVARVGSVISLIHCYEKVAQYRQLTRNEGEVGENKLIGPEIVQKTTDKIVPIEEKLKTVSPWKGVVRFGKKSKISSRYVGPFEIVERVSPVAYRLRLPQELVCIYDTFHVSNLKKCLTDVNLQVPLEEIKIDKSLRFVEEPIEIIDREVKKLKQSRIPIVKF
ncbi:hypothetical protein Tco_0065748 [Tanacetum coccineum]